MGALALTLGGLLVSASPAAADPAYCSTWNTHPDLHSSGNFTFGNGTAIRRGPYTECDALGRGYPSEGIDVHCHVYNGNNVLWFYVRDMNDGTAGWARHDTLNATVGTTVRNCYS